MTPLEWLANLWTAFVSLLPSVEYAARVLVGWFVLSVPVAIVAGRVLRGAERGRQ